MVDIQSDLTSAIISDFKKFIDLSLITIQVSEIDSKLDREKYLSMKECFSCRASLGNKSQKKYFCHFCFNAVCETCSLLTIPHPETAKDERVCNTCYNRYLRLKVIQICDEFVKNKLKQEIDDQEREKALACQLSQDVLDLKQNFEENKKNLNRKIVEVEEKIKKCEENMTKEQEKSKSFKIVVDNLISKGIITPNEYRSAGFAYSSTDKQNPDCIKCTLY